MALALEYPNSLLIIDGRKGHRLARQLGLIHHRDAGGAGPAARLRCAIAAVVSGGATDGFPPEQPARARGVAASWRVISRAPRRISRTHARNEAVELLRLRAG